MSHLETLILTPCLVTQGRQSYKNMIRVRRRIFWQKNISRQISSFRISRVELIYILLGSVGSCPRSFDCDQTSRFWDSHLSSSWARTIRAGQIKCLFVHISNVIFMVFMRNLRVKNHAFLYKLSRGDMIEKRFLTSSNITCLICEVRNFIRSLHFNFKITLGQP